MAASDSPLDSNPYQAPRQSPGPEPRPADYNAVAGPRVVRLLVETRPWVRFMSILGFIGAGLMMLGGLAVVVFGLLAGAPGPRAVIPIALAVFYCLAGILYFVPSLYLFRYANRISEFEEMPHVQRLEGALEAQKSFWRFVGILMAVVIVAYVLLLVVMLGVSSVGPGRIPPVR